MRYKGFWLILTIVFLVLFLQSVRLQLVRGSEFYQRAEENRVKITPILAERGVIYDRKSQVLAQNTSQGREYVLKEAAAHVLGYLGEADENEVKAFSVSLGSQVGKLGVEREFDGILCGTDGRVVEEVDAKGEVLRKIAEKESEKGKNIKLTIDKDLQEKAWELIANRKGAIVVTTPDGKILTLVSSPSFDPNVFTKLIATSLRPELRPRGYQLQEKTGNGKLETRNLEKIQRIFSDPEQPMFNRAIAGLYPPGSTFKIVMATAALETGVIKEDTLIEDIGEIKIGPYTFGNWYFTKYGRKEGVLNIVRAIKRSNDVFFYKTGEALGITRLTAWAREFGLGKKTEVSLLGEADGLVPDEGWKRQVKKDNWYLGDTYITSIGQGDLQTTPLQVNQMTAVIAADGRLCKPRLVEEFLGFSSYKGPTLQGWTFWENECRKLPISEETLKLVKEGMRQACDEGGTGWPFFKFKAQSSKLKVDNKNYFEDEEATKSAQKFVRIPVACKTGTAETTKNEKPHAWFTVFAPAGNPEIVATVILEKAGEGSDEAAPITKEILKEWFEKIR